MFRIKFFLFYHIYRVVIFTIIVITIIIIIFLFSILIGSKAQPWLTPKVRPTFIFADPKRSPSSPQRPAWLQAQWKLHASTQQQLISWPSNTAGQFFSFPMHVACFADDLDKPLLMHSPKQDFPFLPPCTRPIHGACFSYKTPAHEP